MNRYEYICQVDDLGVTVVENIFINHYLPEARGDYVKVYLYGLKCATSPQDTMSTDLQISSALKISEQDVINAWQYWADEKIISIVYEGEHKRIRFENLASIFFGGKKITPSEKRHNIKSNEESVLKEIESKINRTLAHNEKDKILSWIQEYNISPNSVILLVEDCISREKYSLSYWESIARVFYDEGITTYDQAIDFFESRDSKWKIYKEIMSYMGLYRPASEPEKKIMDKWLEEYNLDIDSIKKACDETVGANKPNLQYVDMVIESIRNGDPIKKKSSKGKKSPKPTGTEHGYNYEALEEYLLMDLDDLDSMQDEESDD